MITVNILEAADTIMPTDWCRPLSITSMSGGHSDYYSFKNQYSGCPENNAQWVQVKCVIGKPWLGKTVGEFNKAMHSCGPKYEFLRGDLPRGHKLNMSGYTDLSKLSRHSEDDYYNDDIPF